MHLNKKNIFLPVLMVFTLAACKKWDDHTAVANPALQTNLFEEISKKPTLSKFTEYLVKTGLDKELAASKTFTVWAPSNDALQSLDPAIAADTAKLAAVLRNHIAYQLYYTSSTQATVRVPMLNGKQVNFGGKKFDDANITEGNLPARNGVFHVIDKLVPPLQNVWEFVNSTTAQYNQNAFIASQNFTFQDPNLAIVDSISSTTGLPIYRPGTGMVTRNRFNDLVYDLKDEGRLYTYFVLNNAALKTEVDSLGVFYKTSTVDSTNMLSTMGVVQDAVVEGLYTIDQLPPFLTSKFGVAIPIDKNAIVSTQRVSNGVVYVMNKMDFLTSQKIKTVIIQGEFPRGFYNATGVPVDVRTTTFYRVRTNPVTAKNFNDIFIYNHGVSGLNVLYQAFNLPSVKYKVYWLAVNDTLRVNNVVNPVAFNQRLAMGSRTATTFANVSVPINTYTEVYLGEYTKQTFGTLDMFLTASGTGSLSLDYIRLEPQF
jgi:uncharacterized surface protein with fasciclin (FAS1) repeats